VSIDVDGTILLRIIPEPRCVLGETPFSVADAGRTPTPGSVRGVMGVMGVTGVEMLARRRRIV